MLRGRNRDNGNGSQVGVGRRASLKPNETDYTRLCQSNTRRRPLQEQPRPFSKIHPYDKTLTSTPSTRANARTRFAVCYGVLFVPRPNLHLDALIAVLHQERCVFSVRPFHGVHVVGQRHHQQVAKPVLRPVVPARESVSSPRTVQKRSRNASNGGREPPIFSRRTKRHRGAKRTARGSLRTAFKRETPAVKWFFRTEGVYQLFTSPEELPPRLFRLLQREDVATERAVTFSWVLLRCYLPQGIGTTNPSVAAALRPGQVPFLCATYATDRHS